MLSFAHIVGHRRPTTLLSQAIARETLPPALLFAGRAGVGKYQVARVVAATLNCLSPTAATEHLPIDACGTCVSCDRINRSVHVDIISIEPDDRASIKIDVIRDVLSRTGFRPFEGRRRVVLIREADALEPASQNALLKSLEEPPPGTVFVLTTAVPGMLLPTVRSRCMSLRFGRLTQTEITQVLVRDWAISEIDARAAAGLADGSIAQALALDSADLAVLQETALSLLRQSGPGSAVAGRLQAAAVLVTGPAKKERPREDIALVLRLLASMLRDIELLNSGGDARALANPAVAADLSAVARSFAGDRARDAFAVVDRALMALNRNAGVKVVADWLAVQL